MNAGDPSADTLMTRELVVKPLRGFMDKLRRGAEMAVAKALTWLTSRDGRPGLQWDDVRIAVEWIVLAEQEIPTGVARREWVLRNFKRISRFAASAAAEMLFWTAFNYAEKQGLINIGKK